MILIEWKDEFSLGVASVDFEHREMINLINELHSLVGKGAGLIEDLLPKIAPLLFLESGELIETLLQRLCGGLHIAGQFLQALAPFRPLRLDPVAQGFQLFSYV